MEQMSGSFGICDSLPIEIHRLLLFIASNPDVPAPILEALVISVPKEVRVRIAENAAASQSVLAQLARDCCSEVRVAVADNLNTPLESLWDLVADEDVDVRYTLAENHQIPISLLMKLSEDDHPYVAFRARRTLDRLAPKEEREGLLLWLMPKRARARGS
jgi:hypothetical protein